MHTYLQLNAFWLSGCSVYKLQALHWLKAVWLWTLESWPHEVLQQKSNFRDKDYLKEPQANQRRD